MTTATAPAPANAFRSTRSRSSLPRQPQGISQGWDSAPWHPAPTDPFIEAVIWEEAEDDTEREVEPDYLPGGRREAQGATTHLLDRNGMPGLQSTGTLLNRLYTSLCSTTGLLQRLARAAATPAMQERLRSEAAVSAQQAQRLELAAGLLGLTLSQDHCGLLSNALTGLDDLARMRGHMRSIDVRIARNLIGLASLELDILHAVMRWARERQCTTVLRLMEKCRAEKIAVLESMVRLNARKVHGDSAPVAATAAAA